SSSNSSSRSHWEGNCGTAALRLKICMRLREQALLLQQLEERYLLRQQLLNADRYAKGLRCMCSSSSSSRSKTNKNSSIREAQPDAAEGVPADGTGSSKSTELGGGVPQS